MLVFFRFVEFETILILSIVNYIVGHNQFRSQAIKHRSWSNGIAYCSARYVIHWEWR